MMEILEYSFMRNAFAVGASLGLLLAYLGVFVVLKKMSFFGDGVAHASLAGVAAAVLFGGNPLIGGIIAAIFFAAVIFIMEEKSNISGDAAIGIIFTSGMAIGILLMGMAPGYRSELMSFLFGNILAIKSSEVVISVIATVLFTGVLFSLRKKIGLLSLNEELAAAEGIAVSAIKLFLYIVMAVSVVLGIKILGIILVSAAMIIPASCAKSVGKSFAMMGVLSVIFSEMFMFGGIVSSYALDLPTGSVIVLLGATTFFIIQISSYIMSKYRLIKGRSK
jgi:zinc transport system permease protein